MDTSDFAKRMKDYEKRNRYYLQRRLPLIIRLDMRLGHSFTKGFQRPFDEVFIKTMQETAKYLCENVQNVKMSYQQSDEISLVLVDYEKLNTDSWFDYRVDKLCSIAASMATLAFNKFFSENVQDFGYNCCYDPKNENFGDEVVSGREEDYARYELVYMKRLYSAMFDARVFNLPKEEVTNYFYWRQLDASRNSIQMVGQANFSHKGLQNKSCNDIQDMLMTQKGINWNNLPTYQKRGSCVVKEKYFTYTDEHGVLIEIDTDEVGTFVDEVSVRSRWIIDKNIPIFKGEGREYIEKLINVGEE